MYVYINALYICLYMYPWRGYIKNEEWWFLLGRWIGEAGETLLFNLLNVNQMVQND